MHPWILCIPFTMLKAAKNMRGKLALLYRVTGRPGHRLHIFLNSTYEQKTDLRHNNIKFSRLLPYLCKISCTSFGFCRGLLRTAVCPFRYRRPFFAENRSSAQVIAGLHRFLVLPLSKTLNPAGASSVRWSLCHNLTLVLDCWEVLEGFGE